MSDSQPQKWPADVALAMVLMGATPEAVRAMGYGPESVPDYDFPCGYDERDAKV